MPVPNTTTRGHERDAHLHRRPGRALVDGFGLHDVRPIKMTMNVANAAAPPISVPPIRTLATSASRAPWKIILKPAQMIAIVTTAIEIVTRIALTLVTVVLILSKPCADAETASPASDEEGEGGGDALAKNQGTKTHDGHLESVEVKGGGARCRQGGPRTAAPVRRAAVTTRAT